MAKQLTTQIPTLQYQHAKDFWHYHIKLADGTMTKRDYANLEALREVYPDSVANEVRAIVSPPVKRKAA